VDIVRDHQSRRSIVQVSSQIADGTRRRGLKGGGEAGRESEREREQGMYFFGRPTSVTQFECACHPKCTFDFPRGGRGREAVKSRSGLSQSVNRNCRPHSLTPSRVYKHPRASARHQRAIPNYVTDNELCRTYVSSSLFGRKASACTSLPRPKPHNFNLWYIIGSHAGFKKKKTSLAPDQGRSDGSDLAYICPWEW
jgi:hypothetical protein